MSADATSVRKRMSFDNDKRPDMFQAGIIIDPFPGIR
jgi:hypothetical protein